MRRVGVGGSLSRGDVSGRRDQGAEPGDFEHGGADPKAGDADAVGQRLVRRAECRVDVHRDTAAGHSVDAARPGGRDVDESGDGRFGSERAEGEVGEEQLAIIHGGRRDRRSRERAGALPAGSDRAVTRSRRSDLGIRQTWSGGKPS